MFILFSFFLPDRATHLDEREAREGDGRETKNILWGWPHIFTAWPLILQIFLAQGFMLFFSRGYLSQLQISFNFNQNITGKVYIEHYNKAINPESTTVRRERTGNQNFPAKYAPSALLFNLQNGGRNSATSEEAQEDRKNRIRS